MKEIIGDDYPTYEDSVNATLAEKFKKKLTEKQSFSEEMNVHTYLKEVEYKIHKDNLERLMKENFELRHRLSCIADDIEIIDRHIASYKKSRKWFKQPSLNADGSVYADQAWHNVTNIQIACDLTDDSPLEWGSKFTFKYGASQQGDE
jgi:predicted nuclease with TOPRIM domain